MAGGLIGLFMTTFFCGSVCGSDVKSRRFLNEKLNVIFRYEGKYHIVDSGLAARVLKCLILRLLWQKFSSEIDQRLEDSQQMVAPGVAFARQYETLEKSVNQENSSTHSAKVLLILKSEQNTLLHAEQFLRVRKWDVIATTTLSEALQLLLSRKIDYFLVCATHPNKKLKFLPSIINQLGTVKLLTYAEKASALNLQKIKEMGIPHQILPPVSGPSIERTIILMERELNRKKKTEEDVVEVSGGAPKVGGRGKALKGLSMNMLIKRKAKLQPRSFRLKNHQTRNLSVFLRLILPINR